MSLITSLPIKNLKVYMNLQQAPNGRKVLLCGSVNAVGIRAVFVGAGGHPRSGFVPLEGPDTGVFLDDPILMSMPALDVSGVVTLGLEDITLKKNNLSDLSPGDVCVLTGNLHMSLAVAPVGDRAKVAGYLILDGGAVGEVVTGAPQIRIGKVSLEILRT